MNSYFAESIVAVPGAPVVAALPVREYCRAAVLLEDGRNTVDRGPVPEREPARAVRPRDVPQARWSA